MGQEVIEVAAFLNWLFDEYEGDLNAPEPRERILNKYDTWKRGAPEEGEGIAKVYSFRQIAKPKIHNIHLVSPYAPEEGV